MKGSIFFREDRQQWAVAWRWNGKRYNISRYKGRLMHKTHPVKKRDRGFIDAERLLAQMQGDVENGVFRIEKYTTESRTDVIPFFEKWLERKVKKKPATYKGYKSYFECHIKPFFYDHPVQLHEIHLDVLDELLDSLYNVKTKAKNNECPKCRAFLNFRQRCKKCGWEAAPLHPKSRHNVMMCFHAFMDYAWRSKRIPEIPPFPKKEDYGIIQPAIKWLPSDRQAAIINAIPDAHQPIFWFLKYHLRRPAEACALHKNDYDIINKVFLIRRSISARELTDSTKTGAEHIIPCHSTMIPLIDYLSQQPGQFMFENPRARKEGKRYTNESLNIIWKAACKKAGESIDLYSGLKHSSCSQYVNEMGIALSDLQTITDHARLDSVKRYAKTEVARKREIMEATGRNEKIGQLLRLVR